MLANLQMHKNSQHFYANFHEFYERQLKQQICFSFTQLISYMGFNPFKMAVQLF